MNSRRSFLAQVGILSAGVLLAPSCMVNNDKKAQQKLGLQLYSLRDVIGADVKGTIAKVAQAGYGEVEVYGYSPENGLFGMDVKAFREILDANNLTSPSGHYGFDEYLQGKEDILQRYIEAAEALGHEYITVPYLGEDLRRDADSYQRLSEKLNKAAEITRKSNIQLAYHNHNFEFQSFGNLTGYDILLSETDSANLKFEIDLYWAARAKQNIKSLFTDNKGRFVMWHVKDMDKGKPELNTEIGNGSINYKEIFADAEPAGVKHYFVEQENFTDIDPFVSIQKSADYVKNNLFS